jgi:hypothetical protein
MKTIGITTAKMFSEAKFYALSAGAISFSIRIIEFSGKHKNEIKYLPTRSFLHFTGNPLVLKTNCTTRKNVQFGCGKHM